MGEGSTRRLTRRFALHEVFPSWGEVGVSPVGTGEPQEPYPNTDVVVFRPMNILNKNTKYRVSFLGCNTYKEKQNERSALGAYVSG
jgi:hypothetical protein